MGTGKNIFYGSIIFTVVIILISVVFYLDARSFAKNSETSPVRYVLMDEGRILAGFDTVPFEDDIETFSDEEILVLDAQYKQGDYKSMRADNYKLFIVDIESFSDVESHVFENFTKVSYDYDDFKRIISADSSLDEFVDDYLDSSSFLGEATRELVRNEIVKQFGLENKFRSYFFALMMSAGTEEEGTGFIIKNYRSGNIIVYRKSLIFWLMEYAPESMF